MRTSSSGPCTSSGIRSITSSPDFISSSTPTTNGATRNGRPSIPVPPTDFRIGVAISTDGISTTRKNRASSTGRSWRNSTRCRATRNFIDTLNGTTSPSPSLAECVFPSTSFITRIMNRTLRERTTICFYFWNCRGRGRCPNSSPGKSTRIIFLPSRGGRVSSWCVWYRSPRLGSCWGGTIGTTDWGVTASVGHAGVPIFDQFPEKSASTTRFGGPGYVLVSFFESDMRLWYFSV
mmetsp:Transcript_62091/g.183507  ORF Transcript_62091/g.183507 Transcript_62091/m.183507 type:complete len:235 (-) Transcript_62091:308-1012(-)